MFASIARYGNSIEIAISRSPSNLEKGATEFFADLQTNVDFTLDVALQSATEVAEHRRTTGQYDVLLWEHGERRKEGRREVGEMI